MRFKGEQLNGRATEQITLPRKGLTLTITALPLGYDLQMHELFPMPTPPRERINKKGEPTKYGQARTDDPKYRNEVRKTNQEQIVYLVVEALSADTNVEFDVERPISSDIDEWREYYRSVMREFRNSGFSNEELMYIAESAMQLNTVDEQKLQDKAEQDFLYEQAATEQK